MGSVKLAHFTTFSLFLFCVFSSDASAVWAHRPLCDDEHSEVNDHKNALDKCIVKFEANHKRDDDKFAVQALPERELPCVADLKALIVATESLNNCMEKQMWWKHQK